MTKILIADDEPNILMLIGVLFEEMGFDVVRATDGDQAISMAHSEKPDIIITDVIMPKKNGFEVCKTIRSSTEISNIPIIILSALGDEYNKITGFEEGADDYITKPFNVEELKARVKAVLLRHNPILASESPQIKMNEDIESAKISTGNSDLDDALYGGLPVGSNLLVIGRLGLGKSSFLRQFIAKGIENNERNLYVAVDDAPSKIRHGLNELISRSILEVESQGLIRFIDAYSWSALMQPEDEPYMVKGALDLNQLSGLIADASIDIGHTVQHKLGGRRVIDSISSLLINFDLPIVQRFMSQVARTALAFGGVTTLFTVEENTVSEQVLNNIKYIVDGIIEFDEVDGKRAIRVLSMKWAKYKKEWIFMDTPS
ncbi:MAG: response regulator [Candidatus Margulisbacteria bacterium]|nr:response regulator [Candidatus Margulisiibacteriota bacterium]